MANISERSPDEAGSALPEAVEQRNELNFCQACAVRDRAICADLDNHEVGLLNRIGRRRHLDPGETLLWEGEKTIFVANVVSGVMKLSTQTSDGREQIVGLAYPSDFIGRPFRDHDIGSQNNNHFAPRRARSSRDVIYRFMLPMGERLKPSKPF